MQVIISATHRIRGDLQLDWFERMKYFKQTRETHKLKRPFHKQIIFRNEIILESIIHNPQITILNIPTCHNKASYKEFSKTVLKPNPKTNRPSIIQKRTNYDNDECDFQDNSDNYPKTPFQFDHVLEEQ